MSKKQYQRNRSVHLLFDLRFFSNLGCGRTRSKLAVASSGVKGASETLSPFRPDLPFDLSLLDFLFSVCIVNYLEFAPRKNGLERRMLVARAINLRSPGGALGVGLCTNPLPYYQD